MRLVLALGLLFSITADAKEYAPQVDKKAEAEKQEEEEYLRTHFFDDPLGTRRQPFFGGGQKKSFLNPHKERRGLLPRPTSVLRRR